ncbi:unnamed protein product, partial [Phaeothamnion confervicola]
PRKRLLLAKEQDRYVVDLLQDKQLRPVKEAHEERELGDEEPVTPQRRPGDTGADADEMVCEENRLHEEAGGRLSGAGPSDVRGSGAGGSGGVRSSCGVGGASGGNSSSDSSGGSARTKSGAAKRSFPAREIRKFTTIFVGQIL